MPELPEVETIVRDLRPSIMGRMISGIVMRSKGQKHLLRSDPYKFYEGTIGQEIQSVLRKGKYIIMPLSNSNVIVIHLGMTGKLLLRPIDPGLTFDVRFTGEDHVDKHTHIILELSDMSDPDSRDLELQFNDVRLFGNIWLVGNVSNIEELDVPGLKDLGPDALGISSSQFDPIIDTKRSIKATLLDQNKLAGVGNIYADEACFVAKIHPACAGKSLTPDQKNKLWFAIKTVLKEGIRYRGSSISDYATADGSKGSYQEHHRVYGRVGQKCKECPTLIESVKLAGRTTHFCPSCQPRES